MKNLSKSQSQKLIISLTVITALFFNPWIITVFAEVVFALVGLIVVLGLGILLLLIIKKTYNNYGKLLLEN